jgi:hypothetical protein
MRRRRRPGLSREDEELLRTVLSGEMVARPPTIGVIGVSGVGKSSTINTLFRSALPTSETVACTKEFWNVDVGLELSAERLDEVAPSVASKLTGSTVHLRVVDAPGLGEDSRRDDGYLALYEENLPRCDVILWVLTARNRAVALDQQYLERLRAFGDKIVFGINQSDLVDPLDWDTSLNIPSARQAANLDRIAEDRKQRLGGVLGSDAPVIPYSATTRYNLQKLFTTLLDRSSDERRWAFSLLKGFRFDDFLTVEARKRLADSAPASIASSDGRAKPARKEHDT